MRLPSLFGDDFGDQVTRLATLINSKENQFQRWGSLLFF